MNDSDQTPPHTHAPGRRVIDADTGRELEMVYALPFGPGDGYAADELSLADLCAWLWQGKWLIAGCALLTAALAAAYALQLPRVYRIQTMIEIGRSDNKPVESAENLRQKLSGAYRLQVIYDSLKTGDFDRNLLAGWKPQISVPRGSDLLTMSIDAAPEDFATHIELLQRLIALATRDHERSLITHRQRIQSDLEALRRRLGTYADEREMLAIRSQGLQDEARLVGQQIERLAARLDQADADRDKALEEVTGQAQALTFLMIENAVQTDRQRLETLQQRLEIGIPSEQASLDKNLSETNRREETTREEIAVLEQRLRDFLSTRPLVDPQASLKPVGPRRSLIVIVAFILGAGAAAAWTILRRQLRPAQTA